MLMMYFNFTNKQTPEHEMPLWMQRLSEAFRKGERVSVSELCRTVELKKPPD